MFKPVDGLAVEAFLDGDVAHRRRCRSAMPVLLARREPDDVARTDFLDLSPLTLHPAKAVRHDQRLAERMGVPGRARARLEGDERPGDTGGGRRAEQRIDANRPGEPRRATLARRVGAAALDLHDEYSCSA